MLHFANLQLIRPFFEPDDLSLFESLAREFKERRRHHYREGSKANRHGHSNEKPSYWALGYKNLDEMRDGVCDEEWREYLRLHRTCCGLGVDDKE